MADPEQVVTRCLPSDRSLSLMMGQGPCCGSSRYGCSETKPSMSAQPPTVWERSTLVPSSQSWKVSAREGHGMVGGWTDVWEEPASQPCPCPGLVCVWQEGELDILRLSSGQGWSMDLAWIVRLVLRLCA